MFYHQIHVKTTDICACSNPGLGFASALTMVYFLCLIILGLVVCFVDIGRPSLFYFSIHNSYWAKINEKVFILYTGNKEN